MVKRPTGFDNSAGSDLNQREPSHTPPRKPARAQKQTQASKQTQTSNNPRRTPKHPSAQKKIRGFLNKIKEKGETRQKLETKPASETIHASTQKTESANIFHLRDFAQTQAGTGKGSSAEEASERGKPQPGSEPASLAQLDEYSKYKRSIELDMRVQAVADTARRVKAAKRELNRVRSQARRDQKRTRRRFLADTRFRRLSWGLLASAFVVLIASVCILVFTPIMDVEEIEIVGAERYNNTEFADAINTLKGKPIALVSDTDIYSILQKFNGIESYAFTAIPPHKLVLHVSERTPVIAIAEEGGFAQYDASGVLLERSEQKPEGMPLAVGASRNPGSEMFGYTVGVLRKIPENLRTQISDVDSQGANAVVFHLADGTEVHWGGPEESQLKAIVLDGLRASLGPRKMIDVSSVNAPVYQ